MTKIIFLILLVSMISGCSGNEKSIVKGNVVKFYSVLNYSVIDVRLDCKNPNCAIKTFYFKQEDTPKMNPEEFANSMTTQVLNAQEFDKKIIIWYDDYFLINIMNSAYMQS